MGTAAVSVPIAKQNRRYPRFRNFNRSQVVNLYSSRAASALVEDPRRQTPLRTANISSVQVRVGFAVSRNKVREKVATAKSRGAIASASETLNGSGGGSGAGGVFVGIGHPHEFLRESVPSIGADE